MPTGSGLSGSLGLAQETTVGTSITPARFLEVTSPKFSLDKNTITSTGLRAGARVARAARRVVVTRSATGDVEFDVPYRQFGLVLSHALGTPSPTATQIATTGIYRQIHTLGDLTGRSMTWQTGVPQVDGVVKPFTYPGGKVAEVEFSCKVNEFLSAQASIDAWDELDGVSLAVPSYVAADMAHFAQCTIKLGGTASTASGVVSVASGVAVKSAKSWSWKLTNAMATDRFFLGAAGVKGEQIENDFRGMTGAIEAEFADKTQLYDIFRSDAAVPLEVVFTGPIPAGATQAQRISFIFPAVKLDTGSVSLDGPDIVPQTVNYTVLDDGTNTPAQVLYESPDTAV